MSLQSRLGALITAVGADIKALNTRIDNEVNVVYVNTEAEADALPADTLAIVLNPP